MEVENREFIDEFVDLLETEKMTLSQIRYMSTQLDETNQIDVNINGEDWFIIHKDYAYSYACEYLQERAEDAEDEVMRNVEEHLEHFVSFDRDGWIECEVDGGLEYIFGYYDNIEHEIGNWFAYRQG